MLWGTIWSTFQENDGYDMSTIVCYGGRSGLIKKIKSSKLKFALGVRSGRSFKKLKLNFALAVRSQEGPGEPRRAQESAGEPGGGTGNPRRF